MIRLALLCTLLAAGPAWAADGDSTATGATRSAAGPVLHLLWQMDRTRADGAGPSEAAGEVLTLEEALTIALTQNRLVKNATLDVAKSGDQIASAKTQRYPQPQVTVTPLYRLTALDVTIDRGALGNFAATGPIPDRDTTLRTDPGFSASLQAGVSQPVSQLYKIGLSIGQLAVARDMSRQDLRTQRQAIANNVKQAYYAVLQSQSSLEALQEQIASSRELVRVVTDQAAQGTALQSDVLQARASRAQAEYNAGVTRHNLASQQEQLNHLLGRDPQTPLRVTAAPSVTPLETDLIAAREVALRRRPDLQKAGHQVSYSEYDVRLKQAAFIPDLSLVLKYISPVTSENLPKNIAYVGLEFSWDVWDWGKKRHDMRQSERAREQARNAVAETASQVMLDVNSSFRKLQDAQALLHVTELNREAARESLRVTTNKYGQQSALLKDVLSAQASLGQASDQYRQAALAFWEARANFEQALGTGD